MKKSFWCLIPLTTLLNCSSPYQPYSLVGGYQDKQISTDTYRVDFKGNGFTTKEEAKAFALKRAHEICDSQEFTVNKIEQEINSQPLEADTQNCFININGNSICLKEASTANKITASVTFTCNSKQQELAHY